MQVRMQVYFHLTVRRDDERVLETTRAPGRMAWKAAASRGAFVIGKGLRAPRGWELALSSARHPTPPENPVGFWVVGAPLA